MCTLAGTSNICGWCRHRGQVLAQAAGRRLNQHCPAKHGCCQQLPCLGSPVVKKSCYSLARHKSCQLKQHTEAGLSANLSIIEHIRAIVTSFIPYS